MRKPLIVLAERLLSKNSRGDKMAIELFVGGIRGWEVGLRQRMTQSKSAQNCCFCPDPAIRAEPLPSVRSRPAAAVRPNQLVHRSSPGPENWLPKSSTSRPMIPRNKVVFSIFNVLLCGM